MLPWSKPTRFQEQNLPCTHQSTAAQEDHEDDEGLKPVMFHDEETSLPQGPPRLPQPLLNIDLATLAALRAPCNGDSAQSRMSPHAVREHGKNTKLPLSRSRFDANNIK